MSDAVSGAEKFEACWRVWRAGRELVSGRIPTVELDFVCRGMWRPDRLPRLCEFLVDFERAGAHALAGKDDAGFLWRWYVIEGFPWDVVVKGGPRKEMMMRAAMAMLKNDVGQMLEQRGIWPVRAYFQEPWDKRRVA